MFKNFTYCLTIIFRGPAVNDIRIKYVTEVDNETKTFKYHSAEEIKEQNLKICAFKQSRCIDLMNCIYCNGYEVAMQPYNK